MKIGIIGPGAMGCLFAGYLKEGGLDVTLVDHSEERARGLADQGISIEGIRGEHRVKLPVTADAASVGPVDLVIVCVKAFHTEEALRRHRALVGEGTVVWSAQNGKGNDEAMAAVVERDRIVGGSTTLGANKLGPGQIHHAGEGDTFIGELNGGRSARVEQIAVRLTAAGIKTEVRDDIQRIVWSKLIVNVGINALTAILRVRNGVLVEHDPSLHLMEAAVSEAVRVAAGQGLEFDEASIQDRVKEVARRTARNRSSMLQDMLAGGRTEIDYINGAVARLGDAPVNQALCDLVRALERTHAERQG
ncbi:MAG: 2-dehydropantoate 2-reductase [Deltaproteobacteria bacterium]|nr:2-dehydropantoate 2-reductase [Deltaproteobacteria bacterium]